MGDASSSQNLTGVLQAESRATPAAPDLHVSWSEDLGKGQELNLEPRLVIRYTHSTLPSQFEAQGEAQCEPASRAKVEGQEDVSSLFDSAELIDCKTFEELLLHLENDLVEGIVFDSSVSQQECRYIMGWARIFKPHVRCQRVLPAAHASNGRRSSEVA